MSALENGFCLFRMVARLHGLTREPHRNHWVQSLTCADDSHPAQNFRVRDSSAQASETKRTVLGLAFDLATSSVGSGDTIRLAEGSYQNGAAVNDATELTIAAGTSPSYIFTTSNVAHHD
ncbi:MAG: hypothetical protein M3R60_07960 [Pseudomonadota bacterium]|nr:hypothetical protein [Pseudomonadota bacterium]